MAERCEIQSCGFEWDTVDPERLAGRIRDVSQAIADLLRVSPDRAVDTRPGVWSPVEYGGHVRDVLFNIRDRLVVAIQEDNPLCKGLYGTPRIELGLYAGDTPELVADEVLMAASIFARTWERIPGELRDRTMVYAYPTKADRSLVWVAAQALHEVEHHLADIRAGLAG